MTGNRRACFILIPFLYFRGGPQIGGIWDVEDGQLGACKGGRMRMCGADDQFAAVELGPRAAEDLSAFGKDLSVDTTGIDGDNNRLFFLALDGQRDACQRVVDARRYAQVEEPAQQHGTVRCDVSTGPTGSDFLTHIVRLGDGCAQSVVPQRSGTLSVLPRFGCRP